MSTSLLLMTWLVLTLLTFTVLVRIALSFIMLTSGNPFRDPPEEGLAGQVVLYLLIVSMIIAASVCILVMRLLE